MKIISPLITGLIAIVFFAAGNGYAVEFNLNSEIDSVFDSSRSSGDGDRCDFIPGEMDYWSSLMRSAQF